MESYTIWVCQCCILSHANGECCDSDMHGGDGYEPLSTIAPTDGLAMGLSAEEHREGCAVRETGSYPVNYECDCETDTFSTSRCEGCGSYLHGDRHAMAVFPNKRAPREVTPVMSTTDSHYVSDCEGYV